MITRIVLGLSALALVAIALVVIWLLAASTAHQLGFAEGQASAQEQCQLAQLGALQDVIDSTKGLTAAANTASQALGKTISDRKQADAKTTREIRDALVLTAPLRAGCVFDAGVMQQLDDARSRAAQAAASGIRSPVPDTGGTDQQQR